MLEKKILFSLILYIIVCFIINFPVLVLADDSEELVIPDDAHAKAIEALKALGPNRGAKQIDYYSTKIIGVIKGLEAQSESVKSAMNDLGAKNSSTEIQIDLPGDVLFDFDKWDIRKDAEDSLKKIADIIKAYKSPKVIISGYTDSKGSEEYNQQLSEKRADSVKKWLSDNGGVASEIIETAGYGEKNPVASNENPDGSDNPEGRQKNRRVEILIKK
ncbi:MAG: hypothetical protein A2161_11200 [Candidatus Schekmanbacteria bacterium RBG_13_48_7]|uniref:OmpA-like domain-containing protein n=1 Tax=Candidatus Schekmanbacteria bacterium RBG_13_48_7 TaxID=1817878 RepID=A0A1F7S6X1_9BACT|nr:MAG: hypothetical protein A2161_11200 [Candidatus Schekmanbacteria bacterium RBG_13_48_7]